MKREGVRFEFWQGACKSRWCQAQSTLNLHTKQDAMLKSSISGPKDSLGDEARIPQFSSNTQGGSKPSRPRMDPPSHGQTFHADSSRCSQSVLTFYHGASFGNVSAGTPMISPGNALTTMAWPRLSWNSKTLMDIAMLPPELLWHLRIQRKGSCLGCVDFFSDPRYEGPTSFSKKRPRGVMRQLSIKWEKMIRQWLLY